VALQLNTQVRQAIARRLHDRYVGVSEAADAIETTRTWLGRRLNGTTPMSLNDLELICSRLDIPMDDVLREALHS